MFGRGIMLANGIMAILSNNFGIDILRRKTVFMNIEYTYVKTDYLVGRFQVESQKLTIF